MDDCICGNIILKEEVKNGKSEQCSVCLSNYCDECSTNIQECDMCEATVCESCEITCECCDKILCDKCTILNTNDMSHYCINCYDKLKED